MEGPASLQKTLIPQSTAVQGQPFFVDVSRYFYSEQKQAISFAQVGLPENTGFSIDPISGVVFGTGSFADAIAPQPLRVRIIADNGMGSSVEELLLLSIVPGKQNEINKLNELFLLVFQTS